jgi:Mitochondrial protein up-regulated during meiosis
VGNVKLNILSERMVNYGGEGGRHGIGGARGEKLIVRWKTCGSGEGSEMLGKITELLGSRMLVGGGKAGEFCGIFVFGFDAEGRVESHVIEHAETGESGEKTARVITVTEWLMRKARGREEPELALGCQEVPRSGCARRDIWR